MGHFQALKYFKLQIEHGLEMSDAAPDEQEASNSLAISPLILKLLYRCPTLGSVTVIRSGEPRSVQTFKAVEVIPTDEDNDKAIKMFIPSSELPLERDDLFADLTLAELHRVYKRV